MFNLLVSKFVLIIFFFGRIKIIKRKNDFWKNSRMNERAREKTSSISRWFCAIIEINILFLKKIP